MTVIIAGERSGVGKTTVTLALLAYLSRRGLTVQSFKVGPDYIDPMFHRHVSDRPCRNLDPVLTSELYVQQCFEQHTQQAPYALVEGGMGLFDGAAAEIQLAKRGEERREEPGARSRELRDEQGGQAALVLPDFGSTAHVARLLKLPVLLVVDCSRMSHSIAALVQGYRHFDRRVEVVGVVLNRVGSDRHLELLRSALTAIEIPVIGVLRRQASISIPDRHLGLVPADELPELSALVEQLAALAEQSFNWEVLLPLLEVGQGLGINGQKIDVAPATAAPATFVSTLNSPSKQAKPFPIRIAIAQDAAFSFYYADNLDLLQALGAELIFWSPLQAEQLPVGVQGLYLGGGFPEMFAAQLAANEAARNAVKTAITAGMPTYAECGGLMYLCQSLTTFEGVTLPMVGVLPTAVIMGKKLTLGYRRAIAQCDTSLVTANQIVWGHEFHHSSLTVETEQPVFKLGERQKSSDSAEGWHCFNLHASYVHQHWGATPKIPRRFLQHCCQFQPN